MTADRRLAPSAFPGDDGQANPATRAALAQAAGRPDVATYLRAVAALCADRVLVPVVATATRTAPTTSGLGSDKEAEMSVVSLAAPDGRRALLAFTGLDALQAWDATARPVPVTLDLAASSAVSDGASGLLVDVAGPASLVIDGEVLAALAGGRRVVELAGGDFGWASAAPE